jgi:hypothetical protein
MQQASRAAWLFLVLIVLVHAIQGYRAGVGLGQAKRWIIQTLSGHDPGDPLATSPKATWRPHAPYGDTGGGTGGGSGGAW